ncbi:hypothetical protein, partial [Sinorhizobium meliloti]
PLKLPFPPGCSCVSGTGVHQIASALLLKGGVLSSAETRQTVKNNGMLGLPRALQAFACSTLLHLFGLSG